VSLISIVEDLNDEHIDMSMIDAIKNGMNKDMREYGRM